LARRPHSLVSPPTGPARRPDGPSAVQRSIDASGACPEHDQRLARQVASEGRSCTAQQLSHRRHNIAECDLGSEHGDQLERWALDQATIQMSSAAASIRYVGEIRRVGTYTRSIAASTQQDQRHSRAQIGVHGSPLSGCSGYETRSGVEGMERGSAGSCLCWIRLAPPSTVKLVGDTANAVSCATGSEPRAAP
jgi:hypothetical protein